MFLALSKTTLIYVYVHIYYYVGMMIFTINTHAYIYNGGMF